MKTYFRSTGRTIAGCLRFAGRSGRGELIAYVLVTAVLYMVLNPLAGLVLDDAGAAWAAFVLRTAIVLFSAALITRRFHDFGWSGRWGLVLLVMALRSTALDLLSLVGGSTARGAVEAPLSHVDWLLTVPFVLIYIAAFVVSGNKGANRYGPDPRIAPEGIAPIKKETADAEGTAPAV